MKKQYSLNYEIDRDIDRVAAVKDILDQLPKTPNNTELEQMASYILYGHDENGYNAVQRGEITNSNTRYSSYKKKDDKLLSLDEILENPMADEVQFQESNQNKNYTKKKPTIAKPKYDRKTGLMIDCGDSDIPGMVELWNDIERMEKWIKTLEEEDKKNSTFYLDSFHLYQLKHNLIDMRRHQYYLKDAYKPTMHFVSIDRPKTQYVDWTSDSFYWIPLSTWEQRVAHPLLSSISQNLDDYETRVNDNGTTEVKWVVRQHHFDWENPKHVKALINNYDLLYDQLYEKLDTYGRTLIFDFERYRKMAALTPVREFILQCKLEKIPYNIITYNLQRIYGLTYNENHLCVILAKEIPERIATVAKKYRLLIETPPEKCKICRTCGKALPADQLFFVKNRSRKDGLSSHCKECEKSKRIQKGGQSQHDRRNKETQVLEMQARKT